MRVDKNEPHKTYKDFWDWLFGDWHIIFAISLFIAYFYYLMTTVET